MVSQEELVHIRDKTMVIESLIEENTPMEQREQLAVITQGVNSKKAYRAPYTIGGGYRYAE